LRANTVLAGAATTAGGVARRAAVARLPAWVAPAAIAQFSARLCAKIIPLSGAAEVILSAHAVFAATAVAPGALGRRASVFGARLTACAAAAAVGFTLLYTQVVPLGCAAEVVLRAHTCLAAASTAAWAGAWGTPVVLFARATAVATATILCALLGAQIIPLGCAAEVVLRAHTLLALTPTAARGVAWRAAIAVAAGSAAALAAATVGLAVLNAKLVPRRIAAVVVDVAHAALAGASAAAGSLGGRATVVFAAGISAALAAAAARLTSLDTQVVPLALAAERVGCAHAVLASAPAAPRGFGRRAAVAARARTLAALTAAAVGGALLGAEVVPLSAAAERVRRAYTILARAAAAASPV
jgi:hypothetical protein